MVTTLCSAQAIGFCQPLDEENGDDLAEASVTTIGNLPVLTDLSTQDIIKEQTALYKNTLKLRKHYRQWSRFNIIGKCLPKCYLIAWLSLSLSLWIFHVTVPQRNKPQLWQRLLISYLWPLSLHNRTRPFYYATPKVQREISAHEISCMENDTIEKTPKFVERLIIGKKVPIQVTRVLFISEWSKVESWRKSDSHFLRLIIKCNSLASYFYWACTSNKPVGALINQVQVSLTDTWWINECLIKKRAH